MPTEREQLEALQTELNYLRVAAEYSDAVRAFKADPTPERKARKRELARQVTDIRYAIRTNGRRIPAVNPAGNQPPRKRRFFDLLLGREA